MLIAQLRSAEQLRTLGEMVTVNDLGGRIRDDASNVDDFAARISSDNGVQSISVLHADCISTAIIEHEGISQYTRRNVGMKNVDHILAVCK